MFKKLRIKLTLINFSIVLAILLVIFTFVFISMRTVLTRQVWNLKKKYENTLFDSNIYGLKPDSKFENSEKVFGGVALIIEEDENGLINQGKNHEVISDEEKIELYNLVKNKDKDMKYIELNDKYLITFFIEDDITRYFFVDATQERKIVASIARELLFIFLGSIILVLIGNLFMTKKVIEPIKKAWERQKQFVGDASHELRTPISAIKTNMEIVSEDNKKTIGHHRKWIDNVNKETNRMGNLVNKLLFLSRKDSEHESYIYEAINLAEEVEFIIKEYDIAFKNKQIDFEISLLNTYIKAEKMEIHQLISSIIDNALKYTEKGKVKIKLYEQSHYSVLEISDTGIGISEKEKEKVFERFYRTDKSRSGINKGYGLGLSIVKSIVENYKGKIELFSKLGEGSTFIIKIPTIEKRGNK